MVKLGDATLTSQGQISVPKKIRERMNLKTGARLVFWEDGKGQVIIQEAESTVEFSPDQWQSFLEKTKKEPVTRVRSRKDALKHLDRLAGK